MKLRATVACAAFVLFGCGSNFKAIYTDVRFDDGQIDRLEAAAAASGYKIREREARFVSFKTPATIITFSEDKGMLAASCFDSRDPVECDGVVMQVARKAGIALR